MIVKAGSTNVSVYYYIVQDASGTSPGEPVTGLLFSDIETGGSASYARQGAARVDLELITLASASITHADGGFILVDDVNMPGLYRCDYPDAAFATGIDQVFCQIVVASANNAVAAPILIDIDDNVDQSEDNDTKISLIPTTAMRGTDNAAISSKQDTMETTLNAIPTTAMRGTDSAATSAKQDTMETTLNAIPTTAMRGTDGANTVVPDAAGVAPTAVENREEMDSNSLDLNTLISGQSTINGNVLAIDTAAMRGTDGANTVVPDAAGVAPTVAEILAGGDIDGFSLEESHKLILAASVGILAGAATNSITIQAADGSKTRITATVDADGNRSVVVKDVTG